MKAVCRGIRACGEGSIRGVGYKSHGLRNKRKRTWANERKTADMLAKIRERQGNQQQDFDDYDDNNY